MYISRLKLINFRSYEALDIEPSKGLNIIVGDNANGKTNVLESIFLCTFAKSHRTSHDEHLIRRGTEGAYVGLTVNGAGGTVKIEIKHRIGEGKRMFANGTPLKRSGDLMGLMNCVMFAPETLSVVKGTPQDRRRFMDMALSQLYPAYYHRLQQYNTALKQRNAALKDEGCDTANIIMWDEQLAFLGADIINRRTELLSELSHHAAKLHNGISGGFEFLQLRYKPSFATTYADRDELMRAYDRTRADDIRRGYTSVGPHRDDIEVMLDETDVRYFGSQGQQRTAALAMKLSEIPLVTEIKNDAPVLLLDDVFSELDDGRKSKLIRAMEGRQCFLTCTSLDGLETLDMRDMAIFECSGGELIRIE